jgi:ribonuclease PH
MAKFKTGFTTDREANEMRHVEVEIDFTPNALASILYRQGDTVILACCPVGSLGIPQKAGFTLNILSCLAQLIRGSVENAEAQKAEHKKLND